ncbi:MAG: GIY-YIG nuclease family protein [Deltaproteobacteria bacterium]|nr:GIY-YIG nuclease family protein [Deltaproteobacteria bacterium]
MSDLYFEIIAGRGREILPTELPLDKNWISYALFIRVARIEKITVGRFGSFEFAAGDYIYSGSARKNICARVNRHLSPEKKLRWHIDYLLAAASVNIIKVRISTMAECRLVAAGGGEVVVAGFGASDCVCGCGSHLPLLRKNR